ncbi:MAG: hypothetical protein V3W20_11710 [Candidatus Neomarinimicrobiota bacterium]
MDIETKTVIDEDGQETLIIDLNKLSPRESIDVISCLKEEFDVKFIGMKGKLND